MGQKEFTGVHITIPVGLEKPAHAGGMGTNDLPRPIPQFASWNSANMATACKKYLQTLKDLVHEILKYFTAAPFIPEPMDALELALLLISFLGPEQLISWQDPADKTCKFELKTT